MDFLKLTFHFSNSLANLSNDFKMLKKKTVELMNQVNEDHVANDVRLQFLDNLSVNFCIFISILFFFWKFQ